MPFLLGASDYTVLFLQCQLPIPAKLAGGELASLVKYEPFSHHFGHIVVSEKVLVHYCTFSYR